MEKRRCLYCNTPLPESKRADSKFCNNSCKAWYWEQNKANSDSPKLKEEAKTEQKPEQKIEKGTPLEGLRGVIDNTPAEEIKVQPKQEPKQGEKEPFLSSSKKPPSLVSDCSPTDKQNENPEYKELMDKKVKIEVEIKREEDFLIRFDEDIKKTGAQKNPGKVSQKARHYS